MNTMAAFELASAQGAHGIELDVHLSRDGLLVVIHDYTVDTTTDGRGSIADLTLEELKRLDAGAWFSKAYAGERIPTLDEVFAAFGDSLLFNVEIKPVGDRRGELETAVAACISRHRLQDGTIVSSFDPQSLRQFRDICPDVVVGFLHLPGPSDVIEALVAGLPHEARHPWHEMIDEAYMRWAKENELYVNAWTVNDPQRAIELRKLGVNLIITDEPDNIID